MKPCIFLDVDNCGNVDMRGRHMGLDKAGGEREYPRTLGVSRSTSGPERAHHLSFAKTVSYSVDDDP